MSVLAGIASLCLSALAALPPGRPAAAPPPDELLVAPGSVVRWEGEGTETCSLGTRSFAPIGATCWFAVDLQHPEGPLKLQRVRHGVTEKVSIRVGPDPYPEENLEVDDRMVHLSAEDRARVAREDARVEALWESEEPPTFKLPLARPVPIRVESGGFGTKRTFNGEPRSPHTGMDYKAPLGTPVLAADAGVVVLAEEQFFAGNCVFVDHGGGLVSMYFHLSRIDVKPGDKVRRGKRIGAVGETGRALGAHLHFGTRLHGARVDPGLLLRAPWKVPAVPKEAAPKATATKPTAARQAVSRSAAPKKTAR